MRAALQEARKGLGLTSPNPPVGAVIVKEGTIIATGHHKAAGRPHAEIEAIRAVHRTEYTHGATIYVTLEPCSTHGRTPPCTEALIRAGFRRVVYGMSDPNPAHAGRARNLLEEAGIKVTTSVGQEECRALLRPWSKWVTSGLPWIVAKAGMSLDGRISSHPQSRWITSAAARKDAMRLRRQADAILVGAGTIRDDDPRLTIRGKGGRRQPLRVVWSPSGQLPDSAQIFTDQQREKTLVLRNPRLKDALQDLGRRGVVSVLIEGGGKTLGEAFDARLVDEVCWYVAPDLLGGPVPAVGGEGIQQNRDAIRLTQPRFEKIGRDLCINGVVER